MLCVSFVLLTPRVPVADSKKKLVRKYIVSKNFYSYNAADENEDPCKRWIGREVKRFLQEAHIHLPFLLRMANAPADLVNEVANATTSDGGCSPLLHIAPCCAISRHLAPSRL